MTKKFVPQQKNANKHTLHGLRLLEKSIQQDGFIDAQTAAADGEIISGSARLELSAEKFAGVDPIIVESDGTRPVVVVRTDIPDASDPRARRLSIAANQIGHTDWNPDGELLREWGGEDEAIRAMFADSEWKDITGEEKPTKDAPADVDRAAEALLKWKVERGQLWEIGNHRLLCGDSTDRNDIAKVLQGEKVDTVWTDPPYNVGREYGEQTNDDQPEEDYTEWTRSWVSAMFSGLAANADVFVTTGHRYYHQTTNILKEFGSYVWTIAWVKKNSMMRSPTGFNTWEPVIWVKNGKAVGYGNKRYDILDIPMVMDDSSKGHPTPKPVPLILELFKIKGDAIKIVLDCFGGGGSMFVACENLGISGRAIEIEPLYCSLVLQRMADAFPGIDIRRLE